MAGSGELWIQCFSCCLNKRRNHNERPRPRRHRLDRSMISAPTNFRHTAHISSGDLDMNASQLSCLQAQMQRKGGYENTYGVKIQNAY